MKRDLAQPGPCPCSKPDCPYAGEEFDSSVVTYLAGWHLPFPARPLDTATVLLFMVLAVAFLGPFGPLVGPLGFFLWLRYRIRQYRGGRTPVIEPDEVDRR